MSDRAEHCKDAGWFPNEIFGVYRGVGQSGSLLLSDSRGRGFKSRHPDKGSIGTEWLQTVEAGVTNPPCGERYSPLTGYRKIW